MKRRDIEKAVKAGSRYFKVRVGNVPDCTWKINDENTARVWSGVIVAGYWSPGPWRLTSRDILEALPPDYAP